MVIHNDVNSPMVFYVYDKRLKQKEKKLAPSWHVRVNALPGCKFET